MAAPWSIFTVLFRHQHLIRSLAGRELAARYRGSVLGGLWAILTPVLMLAVYAFVFVGIFPSRWGQQITSPASFVIVLFAGLIIYGLFAEVVTRAPRLVVDNPSYVKKIVFPLPAFAWIAVLQALVNAGIATVILLAGHWLMIGPPPLTALLAPIIILPLVLAALGLAWFLAALGVFLRDLPQIVTPLVTALLFLSPVFYPVSAVPEASRWLFALNPLAPVIDMARAVLIWGDVPGLPAFGQALLTGWLIAWAGLMFFRRTERGFADVL